MNSPTLVVTIYHQFYAIEKKKNASKELIPKIIRTDHDALNLNGWQRFENRRGRLHDGLNCCRSIILPSFTARAGQKHGNADAMSWIPCQQCGREDTEPTAGSMLGCYKGHQFKRQTIGGSQNSAIE